jgi:hypothetical protein
MPADDKKARMHQDLVDGILGGPGEASPEQRSAAFNRAGLPDPVQALLDKVGSRSWSVTDADVAGASSGGFSDDQIFELVVCAAVGEATRQYHSGLAALSAALDQRETRK